MGTFELDGHVQKAENSAEAVVEAVAEASDHRRLKEECIIAIKVYDQCRAQDCLTSDIIGPARIVPGFTGGATTPIIPPREAASVSIDDLVLSGITVVNVEPCAFKRGYWDVSLRYAFDYTLNYRDAAGNELDPADCKNVYDKKVTMFGSVGNDIVIGTDLFAIPNDSDYGAPNVFVEGKAIPLGANLVYPRSGFNPCEKSAVEVDVTIGLFTIIKLIRPVCLSVQSYGFCKPPKCNTPSPKNPCEFFNELDFPMNIFDPPHKDDFRDDHKPDDCD